VSDRLLLAIRPARRSLHVSLFFLFGSLIIVGCSNPAILDPVPQCDLSPPEWIWGTWSDESGCMTYAFTADNVISILDAGSGPFTINYKEFCLAAGGGISDSGTDTAYTLNTGEAVYWFVKLTETTLNYSISTGGMNSAPIVLYRQ
jgi:hypothetical protein